MTFANYFTRTHAHTHVHMLGKSVCLHLMAAGFYSSEEAAKKIAMTLYLSAQDTIRW